MKIKFIASMMLTMSFTGAISAEIDVSAEMAARLGDVASKIWQNSVLRNVCYLMFTQNRDNCGQIVIKNMRQIGETVEYLKPEMSPIPVSAEYETYMFRNCSDVDRHQKQTYSTSVTEGYTINTSNSLVNTDGASFAFNISGSQIGLNASQTINTEKSQNFNTIKTTTRNVEFDELVKSRTALEIKVEKRYSNDYYKFKGIVRVDGDVILQNNPFMRVDIPPTYHGAYSSYGVDDRFAVEGEIWNLKGLTFSKSYREIPLGAVECDDKTANADNVVRKRSVSNSPKISESRSFITPETPFYLQIPSALSRTGARQVTESLPDGGAIETGDVYGNVEVRAKSFGPGFCGAIFTTHGASTQFLAPPYTWSPWSVLTSSFGKNRISITVEAKCDTGVSAEVRYWK